MYHFTNTDISASQTNSRLEYGEDMNSQVLEKLYILNSFLTFLANEHFLVVALLTILFVLNRVSGSRFKTVVIFFALRSLH